MLPCRNKGQLKLTLSNDCCLVFNMGQLKFTTDVLLLPSGTASRVQVGKKGAKCYKVMVYFPNVEGAAPE